MLQLVWMVGMVAFIGGNVLAGGAGWGFRCEGVLGLIPEVDALRDAPSDPPRRSAELVGG